MPVPNKKTYTADEFFKFAETSSEYIMELIKGEIVYQASPSTKHQKLSLRLSTSIDNYITSNKGFCDVYQTIDVKLNEYNVVVPDISVICDTSKLDDKRCNGAPDWIIEIVSSNWKDDYIRKLPLYQENGVREYWIVDPQNEKTLVYYFEEDSRVINFYDFSQNIPVNIYKNNPIQLEINIAELLK